jgi:Raf kinase inhibitor-like YbhB/YbcL family protein
VSQRSAAALIGFLALGLPGSQMPASSIQPVTGVLPAKGTCASYELTGSAAQEPTPEAIERTRSIIAHRIEASGVADAVVLVDDAGRAQVTIPGLTPDHPATVGIRRLIPAPGVISFLPVPPALLGQLAEGPAPAALLALEPIVTADGIDGASLSGDSQMGEPVIDLVLDDAAAAVFDGYAADHLGGRFALVIDDTILALPIINAAAYDGRLQISGVFTEADAQRAVILLQSGPLPLALREVRFGTCGTPGTPSSGGSPLPAAGASPAGASPGPPDKAAAAPAESNTGQAPRPRFWSPAFESGADIPRRFTCDGSDESPRLAWSGFGSDVVEFAVVVTDPDAHGFVHWVVTGIPGNATGLPEGAGDPGRTAPWRQGPNDFGRQGWAGPCPPARHTYEFRLYASPRPLRIKGRLTPAKVAEAARAAGADHRSFKASYVRP